MLRQFLDPDGSTIHYIAEGYEDTIKPEWTEIEHDPTPPGFVDPPYFIKRMNNYPPVGEQLDMLWHMMDNETIPGKGSDWYNAILAIKTTYPKPE